ncbi:probable tRNA methyltransferase 9B [Megalops cyprinoides]|uniref:probable tRNA methyltransferase 9B n=1 Tax=Megalops cyprinoides TaxID=118141 RepID=UPI0018646138|nr:probable tRNA methyltransferase 9B [Megalops cyprinoides]
METEAVLLEKQHVHNVYEKTAPYLSDLQDKAWPRVRQFLLQQEPGALVADIGCGTGKYLDVNPEVYTVGCDLCGPLVDKARKQGNEVLVCDNLQLPFRDRVFSAVISIGVLHHFSTPERRICAIKEMARTMTPGGVIMIYVWAQEQKHRRFHKQDVLVPWNKALCSKSSSESGEVGPQRDDLAEECRRMEALGGEANTRRSHSVGNCMPVGRCCVRFPSPREKASRACLGKSLRSWFFSKSLDESSMKRYIERIKPMVNPPKWIESAVLVQPTRHCSIDLGLGGPLLNEPGSEEDDVFMEAPSNEEEQWLKVAGALNEINASPQGRVRAEYITEGQQYPPAVKCTNDLNCIKKRAMPLDSTDSILETIEVDGQEDGLLDSRDLMRYYHVFREGELSRLIEENVPELSVQSSCFDHGNWCIIAKKNV